MPKVRVHSGVCGFHATVEANAVDMMQVEFHIESTCPHITALAQELRSVNPFKELRPEGSTILETSRRLLPHAACPVPAGIVKAMEVAAGLALPRDASITFED